MPHEFDGEKYKNASTHQKEWGNKIISEFNLKGDEHILDLGCGDGILTAQLASMVPDGYVIGIDASQGMIEATLKLESKNLSFKLLDINCLDFKDEFDVIFSNATLHWVKDHNSLLANTFRSLKEKGIIRFNFAADGNCSNFIRLTQQGIKLPKYTKHFSGFEWPWYMPRVKDYKALVSKFPFSEAKVWEENADRYFPNVDSLIKWLDQPSLVPFLEHLPQAEKPEFRSIIIKKMIEMTLQKDGRCFETFRRINVFARK
jgi:trans-aconitate 2-methyltransferase